MRQFETWEQFPLIRTSLPKMYNFSMFPADPSKAFCQFFNFSNFQEKEKTAKLINAILEKSSPHRPFGEKKLKYEISILLSDSRYFWLVALDYTGSFLSALSPFAVQFYLSYRSWDSSTVSVACSQDIERYFIIIII